MYGYAYGRGYTGAVNPYGPEYATAGYGYGWGGTGVGIITIAVLILIALGVIF